MTCVTLASSASVLWREKNTSGSRSIVALAWPYKKCTRNWWVPSLGKCLAVSPRKDWPSPCWPPSLLNAIWFGRSLSCFLSNLWPTFHRFYFLLPVILPKYCPHGTTTSLEFHGSYADSNRGDAGGVDTLRRRPGWRLYLLLAAASFVSCILCLVNTISH